VTTPTAHTAPHEDHPVIETDARRNIPARAADGQTTARAPGFAEIFAHLRIGGIERDRPQIIADPLLGAAELTSRRRR